MSSMSSINSIKFQLWSAASILQSSLFEVTNARCLTNGICTKNGLRDPRFGCIGQGTCEHCHLSKHHCQGHWAHIRLRLPVIHVGLVNTLIQELRAICAQCGVRETSTRGRMLKRCECGHAQAKYCWVKRSGTVLRDNVRYNTSDILLHLARGNGNTHLILTLLPVPPVKIRPPLTIGTRTRGENDLTYRLQNIMRKNIHLGEAIDRNMPSHIRTERFDALQQAVSGYFDHDKVGSGRTTQTRREYTSLTGRIKGKEGTMRGHCMGKRVNQSGRCVVTGDNRLRLGEIGVPHSIAQTLTKPVTVTSHNIHLLQQHMKQGIVRYVVRPNGSRIDCTRSPDTRIDVGCVLECSLQNGDIVLFNRQPSLHKMSIMAHEVRVLPHDTLRFNVACTTPYNADFDGDEMNIHVPQTLEAQAEAREIMAVKYQVVSPQASRPVISIIQDTMLGAYLLSAETLDRATAFQVTQQPIAPPYTGHRIISQLLPHNIYYQGKHVLIERGVMLQGTFRKDDLGSASGSLIHVMFNDCGPQTTVDFIFQLEQVVSRFLSIRGFTVGMHDLTRSHTLTQLCTQERQRAFTEVQTLTEEIHINQRLNKSRDIMGAAAMSELTHNNQFFNMIDSGSKGSMVNITQIQAAIGQQNVQGKRIQPDWTGRTMTCFRHEDHSPMTRGFVPHTYLEGLTPVEMYFCAMAGREGLIDTAIKTAQTGYISRRLMKCLENIIIANDGSARDGHNVIQFKYGDDGLDAMRIEHQQFTPCHTASDIHLQVIRDAPRDTTLHHNQYHLPIPISRILHKLGHKATGGTLLPNLSFIDVPLVHAFVAAHTPPFKSTHTRDIYEQIIQDEWDKCKVVTGESVGAIAAQSIGERATQCTLNTFHFAGVSSKNVTLGLPRLEELLNLTKKLKTPLTTFNSDSADLTHIKRVCLQDILIESGPVQTNDADKLDYFWVFPDPMWDPMWDEEEEHQEPIRWLLRWHDPISLAHTLHTHGIKVVYSEVDTGLILCHVWNTVSNPSPSNIFFGIEGAEWCKHVGDVVETSTTNLHALLTHITPQAAHTLYTNDVHVIYNTLGIEAARTCILRELRKILAHYGIDLNVRHILLLADWMTHTGILTPMTRHGLKKIDHQQPLKQATFEEVVGVFLRAAVEERTDNVDSVSASILTGKPATMGSNLVHVIEQKEEIEEEDLFGDWVATAAPAWLH